MQYLVYALVAFVAFILMVAGSVWGAAPPAP
jgi:hypothetical protein